MKKEFSKTLGFIIEQELTRKQLELMEKTFKGAKADLYLMDDPIKNDNELYHGGLHKWTIN
jgi:hypothetical protein